MTTLPYILIVDDDADFARLVQITLLETGKFEAEIARNCDEGLALIRKRRPDVVTLDLMMPEKSGGWLYNELKNDPEYENLPIIVLSAIVENPDGKLPGSRDPAGLISLWKPVSPDVLLGAIHAEILKSGRT